MADETPCVQAHGDEDAAEDDDGDIHRAEVFV